MEPAGYRWDDSDKSDASELSSRSFDSVCPSWSETDEIPMDPEEFRGRPPSPRLPHALKKVRDSTVRKLSAAMACPSDQCGQGWVSGLPERLSCAVSGLPPAAARALTQALCASHPLLHSIRLEASIVRAMSTRLACVLQTELEQFVRNFFHYKRYNTSRRHMARRSAEADVAHAAHASANVNNTGSYHQEDNIAQSPSFQDSSGGESCSECMTPAML